MYLLVERKFLPYWDIYGDTSKVLLDWLIDLNLNLNLNANAEVGSLLSVVSHLLTQKRHESQRNIGCCSCISPNILSKNGLSQRSIARQLNVAQSSVSKTLKGIQDEGSYRSRERSGRPQKTSQASDRLIHRIAVSNPSAISSEIASRLPNECPVPSSCIQARKEA